MQDVLREVEMWMREEWVRRHLENRNKSDLDKQVSYLTKENLRPKEKS